MTNQPSFAAFLIEVLIISLTGVMAPGPMSTFTAGKGSENPHAGAFVALGHGVVEVPLIIALFFGAGAIFQFTFVKAGLALAGGMFLLFMAIGMFKNLKTAGIIKEKKYGSAAFGGIILSLANPYFLIWWATVGISLIFKSYAFGIAGLVIFIVVHWLCDFVWCYFLSAISFKGKEFFGNIFQKVIFALSAGFLLFFSGKFIYEAVKSII